MDLRNTRIRIAPVQPHVPLLNAAGKYCGEVLFLEQNDGDGAVNCAARLWDKYREPGDPDAYWDDDLCRFLVPAFSPKGAKILPRSWEAGASFDFNDARLDCVVMQSTSPWGVPPMALTPSDVRWVKGGYDWERTSSDHRRLLDRAHEALSKGNTYVRSLGQVEDFELAPKVVIRRTASPVARLTPPASKSPTVHTRGGRPNLARAETLLAELDRKALSKPAPEPRRRASAVVGFLDEQGHHHRPGAGQWKVSAPAS